VTQLVEVDCFFFGISGISGISGITGIKPHEVDPSDPTNPSDSFSKAVHLNAPEGD
jgi:hypothetical protein